MNMFTWFLTDNHSKAKAFQNTNGGHRELCSYFRDVHLVTSIPTVISNQPEYEDSSGGMNSHSDVKKRNSLKERVYSYKL